ncbi:LssY C-terminal domain-containing protein [Falsarthrobacter nasiphocae]|uniref:LssY-like C-terminal domain-containing protein n=1 Tax=Falsarthrobacter nasiphocae TaxID=189863 RepID=A0AAE4C6I9_9MICC|nr:LssY C-terminal domain-containing protein [Falsarthrobacter nasiphocae]MDR6892628.1 hypothetical protein [Falsarthrobacter nasiphocae]
MPHRTVPGAEPMPPSMLDQFMVALAGLASLGLAVFLIAGGFRHGWLGVAFVVPAWGVLAYLALPRLNAALADVYVPANFMGRARTSDGLLGDPVNLAVSGSREHLIRIMTSAGWVVADPITARSSWGIIRSTLRRSSYPSAPVSPLLVFGRPKDLAFEMQVDGNPKQRHHVRFWACPEGWRLPGGDAVQWLGGATYDKAVRLSLYTLQVTHRVAADTDSERDHVVSTLSAAQPGLNVRRLTAFSSGYRSRNGGGDVFVTDGALDIISLGSGDTTTTAGAASAPAGSVRGRTVADLVRRRPLEVFLAYVFLGLSLLQAAEKVIAASVIHSGLGVGQAATATLALAIAVLAWGALRGSRGARSVLMVVLVAAFTVTLLDAGTQSTRLFLATALHATWLTSALVLLSSREAARSLDGAPRGGRGVLAPAASS